MKAPDFRYLRPKSLNGALDALSSAADVTKILAGGQSLLPVLNMRLAEPEVLLDISGLAELRGNSTDAQGRQRYGSCTIHADFEDGVVPDVAGGLLRATARGIGYRAIRNKGTVGGSLAHADPSAEWPVVMCALGAGLAVHSPRGQREIACQDLFTGYFTTALDDDEIIAGILVRPLPEGGRWGLHKFTRKAGEFAESIAAAVVRPTDDAGRGASVWLGGAASTPVRCEAVEQLLADDATPQEDAVVDAVAADLARVGAASAADDYRRHLHGVTVWRAVAQGIGVTDPPTGGTPRPDQES